MPALAVQSEYGFTVSPWFLSGGSSLTPQPSPDGPDPRRERSTGFDAWRQAGVDSMLVVPRASTHLEYTDIPLVLPASRYGQDLTSVYVQRWLDRYLKHRDNTGSLLGTRFRYLEPVGEGDWAPVAPAPRRPAELQLLLGVRRAHRHRPARQRGHHRRRLLKRPRAQRPAPTMTNVTALPPQAGVRRSALAEPTTDPPARWVAFLTLASIGLWAGFFGPIQVLLAQQAEAISATDKREILSVVLGLGAFTSVVCNPLFGAFSDRTTLLRGRRLPWVAGGALGGALSLVLLSTADNVVVMALGWCGVQATLNAMLAAVTATVPDQVPVAPARPGRRHPRGRADARRRRRHRDRVGDRQHRGRLHRDRGRPGRAGDPLLPGLPRHPAGSGGAAGALPVGRVPAVVLGVAADLPRLRVGLADPVPGQPRQRARAALPPLLHAGRRRLLARRGAETGSSC